MDLTLETVQFYTDDEGKLAQALEEIRERPTSRFSSSDGLVLPGQTGSAIARTEGSELGQAGSRGELVYLDLVRQFEAMQEEYAGYASSNALLAILQSLRLLPGRKSVLFFSEGVDVPTSPLVRRLGSVIDTANRSNVALYTVDAAGLRLQSTAALSSEVTHHNALAAARAFDERGGEEIALGRMESTERALRSDPHYALNRMAQETGGLFIRDTNDLKSGLREVDEDMQSYYLLGYLPRNLDFDGRYRKIEVRAKAPGALVIRYRKGYYAVNRSFDLPVLEHEAPAIALLLSGREATALPLDSSTLVFPRKDQDDLVVVLTELSAGEIGYSAHEENLLVSDLTLLTLASDADGKIVRKNSQQYRLGRRPDEGSGGDSILFYREMKLPPGSYSIAVGGVDAVSGRESVSRATVQLQPVDSRLPRLSSLVVVSTAERLE